MVWLLRFYLQISVQTFHKRFIISMHNNTLEEAGLLPLERLHLQPLSLNLPFPCSHTSRQPKALDSFTPHRPAPVLSARHNKSASLKTIAELKSILSKSLFHKKSPITSPTKQKPKDDLVAPRSDSKPISPQSQQKQCLGQEKGFSLSEPHILQEVQNQSQASNINQLFDSKFNSILELNLSHQLEMGLQIQSKFITKKSQKCLSPQKQVPLLQPTPSANPRLERLAAHEKMLQEQNSYIREQLIMFTQTIDSQRLKSHEYKHKARSYNRQNTKLKQKTNVLIEELSNNEEKYYSMSLINEEYITLIGTLEKGKEEMRETIVELSKECEDIFFRLENYEAIKEKELEVWLEDKNKERDHLTEDISEKNKEIDELNELVQLLKHQLKKYEKTANHEEKVNTSINSEEEEENEKSSICLSFAEAQSLKLIIENKEQMFQQEIDTLRRKSSSFEGQTSKKIEELSSKVKQFELQKELHTERESNLKTVESLQEELKNQVSSLQLELDESRRTNSFLREELLEMDQKYRSIDSEQDEELQDLLENCVEELEKERNGNQILREEINNLKRMFAKQLSFVQRIESNIYAN